MPDRARGHRDNDRFEGTTSGGAVEGPSQTAEHRRREPSTLRAVLGMLFVDLPLVWAMWFIPALNLPVVSGVYLDLLGRNVWYSLITVAGLVVVAKIYARVSTHLFGGTIGGILAGNRTVPGRSRNNRRPPGAGDGASAKGWW